MKTDLTDVQPTQEKTMSQLDAVTQEKDDTWTFECPGVPGDACGPFVTNGWPTKKSAAARGAQHLAEHNGEGVMQDLAEFRKDQGLVVNDDGSVSEKGN